MIKKNIKLYSSHVENTFTVDFIALSSLKMKYHRIVLPNWITELDTCPVYVSSLFYYEWL